MNVPRNKVSFAARILLTLAGASLALAAACSSSDDVTCGEGTVKRGNACVVAAGGGGHDGGGGDGGAGLEDGGAGDAGDALTVAAGPCGNRPGPKMVEIPLPDGTSFCMDSTKVTVAQYRKFLEEKPPLTLDASREYLCSPGGNPPNPDCDNSVDDHAVQCLTWCDADAYCKWAGKRLCKNLVDPVRQFPEPGTDEWGYVCMGGRAQTYPYGMTYVEGACVDGAAVGQATCEGGFPGIYDLLAAPGEWQAHCLAPDPLGVRSCLVEGFSLSADKTGSGRTCSTRVVPGDLDDTRPFGIRCCADL